MKTPFRLLPYLLPLLCAGCAPNSVFTPVEVKVPVAVPCKVEVIAEPSYNLPKLPQTASMFEKAKALIADQELKNAYEAQLRAAAESCSF